MPSIPITASETGDTLIPAQGVGKAVQLVSWDVTANAATIIQIKAGADLLWGTYATNVAGGGAVIPYSPARLIQAGENTPVTVEMSADTQLAGSIDYNIVDVLT